MGDVKGVRDVRNVSWKGRVTIASDFDERPPEIAGAIPAEDP